ncbi:uncharacterized protein LODBEIA_P44450 [Lodderomyces beijingensis]|uniref:Ubiquitin carboxyl-terminal hydrolase n=1 Tax=Lodderomyces beijingensis TaxID=1775926 RepID=A0ABP0ZSZ0_9ASCO
MAYLDLPIDIPKTVPPNAKVYKDDCIYSYDTPENNSNGIDVDLKTYKSYSRNADVNYTRQNYERTGNKLYLNINKTLKPQDEINKLLYDEQGEKNSKIQKLEIKDVRDDDYYVTNIGIYDVSQDKMYSRDEVSKEFNSLIEQILESNSSNKNEEIKQWEQEIVPCPHSIDLHPSPKPEFLDLTKCKQCDLKENLWICLHCGTLGCGRSQFGSSLTGNGHALQHYESNSDHPVALKLGSLSNDADSCDAYCYQCNEEVKVPDLALKIKVFGIDLSTAQKTEKSLVELNIDQNLNWDFKLEGAGGAHLPPVYGKGLTGMQNLGNSCYMNSVLQSLFDLNQYSHFFKNQAFDLAVDPTEDLRSQLIKLYDGIYSGRYSVPGSLKGDDYQLGIKPFAFKSLIGKNHEEFKTQRQQDAFEFLQYLLGKEDSEFGLELNKAFKFLFASKVICANCKHGSIKDELLDSISVPIIEPQQAKDGQKEQEEKTSIAKSLQSLTARENIEGYQCDDCHAEPGLAWKTLGFFNFPEYLILNVQRIKLENWTPKKVDTAVEIPFDLDLSKFGAPSFVDDEVQTATPASSQKPGNTFEANQEALNTLLAMGFPEPRCIKALHATGNSSAEDAMNWLFAHMDDPDIDAPLLDLSSPQPSSAPKVSDEAVATLASMGFSSKLAAKALHVTGGDPNAAVEWLFANPDDDGEIAADSSKPAVDVKKEEQELAEALRTKPGSDSKYALKSVICHKGTSPHTGHYVVFIKKLIDNEWKWVQFNDEKVVLCDESNLSEIEKTGYVYIFEKVH